MASTSAAAKKRSRASAEQMRAMVDMLGETEGLASGRFQRMHGKLDYQNKWKELCGRLNAMGGAVKSVEQWHNVWRDLKSRTSIKVRDRKQQRGMTGNRPISVAGLTEMDLRITELVGECYMSGNDTCPESVPLNEQDEEMMEERLAMTDSMSSGSQVEPSSFSAQTPTPAQMHIPTTPEQKRTPTQTPKTPAQTPRRSISRNVVEVDRFLKIAENQADNMRMLVDSQAKLADAQAKLADAQAKQADAQAKQAEALLMIGRGVEELAKAFNRVADAMRFG